MIFAIAAALGLIVAIIVQKRFLSARMLGSLGFAFIAAGIAAISYVEFLYLPSQTKPVDVAINLARAGVVLKAPFRARLDGRYKVWLQTDRTPGVERFGCLTGDDGFEALCPGQIPELEIRWMLLYRDQTWAHGGSDLEAWRQRQARIDPAEQSLRLKALRSYLAQSANPSDGTPLFHTVASFDARASHDYVFVLSLVHSAPSLAHYHPRLAIGFAETGGVGRLATIFCLLCVAGGFYMLLVAFVPRKALA